ncbi:MAG: hypothetical protein AAB353_10355 [Candidatus Hydrogenedentota bacterium]
MPELNAWPSVFPAMGTVFTIALAALAPFGAATFAQDTAVAVKENSDTWPAFEAPPLGLLDDARYRAFGLRLLGIDAVQHGRRLSGTPLEIDGDAPLLLRLYWMPERTDIGSARIRLKSWSHDSRIVVEDEFAVEGDTPRISDWKAGRLYKVEHTWDPRAAATSFSGKSFLTLGFQPTGAPANSLPVPLITLKTRLGPALSPSVISRTEYPRFFGEDYRALGAWFRLGWQASITVPVPEESGDRVRAIGVASAFSFGSMPQGARVATVTAILAGGGEMKLALNSGESTAKADYDFFPPGHWDHQKIDVLESTAAGYLSAGDTPFIIHKYGGELHLPGGPMTITALRFYMDSPIILDVYDIVLIGDGAAPAQSAP